jgi:ABC-type nitrate/sulfonate/bicarbonate transport system substrate-binding protein
MLDRTRFDRSAGRMTRGTMVRGVTALFGAGLDIAAGGGPSSAVMPDPVNIDLNHDAFNLPIFVAIDKGYFAQQNLDVRVQKISGSTITQLPSLARGSIDIAPIGLGPGFFNQYELKIR